MDYQYDEQEQDVADLAATILGDGATPDRLADIEASGEPIDRELWAQLAKAGLIGIAIPEEQGGSGAGFVEQCLVIEAAARAAAPLFLIESAVAAALPVSRYGTQEQHRRLIEPYTAGHVILTAAPTEPSFSAPGFNARAVGESWRVDGAMAHVPLAGAADRVLVHVTDDQGRPGLLLVDPNGPGATLTPHSSVDQRPRHRLELDGCRVPQADVVAAPGTLSPEAAARLAAEVTVARSIAQLGVAEKALEITASYAGERRQFDRPIGSFQAVAHKAADAYIHVQGVRLTAWRAAWLLAHKTVDQEAVAIAAWWAATAPPEVLETAMQVHGGIGVDLDYPLHRYFLAARQGSLSLGGPTRTLNRLGDLVAVV
ncbi:acyl-CoA dehydrogenase family protein [Streptomyces mirabilis]|uniref:acyl-CoA dehydrogenase family protein n=1 Tax=Streptomyces mirabilis TaxID=68239 RepID=UPI0033B97483